MDALDRKILQALALDARTPYAQIAKQLGVATGTIHQRAKRMVESGIIKGFRLELDWEAVGLPIAGVVSLRTNSDKPLGEVAADLRQIPYVASCVAVTGEFDLYLTIRAHSSEHLGEMVDEIRRIAKASTRTVVVLATFYLGITPPLEAAAQPPRHDS